ncbi:MAG: hypothetical protein RML35_11160 [Chloroherpetonaceae bacterium]|nr:hypothetical protein [Chloroherpetonaceae bacterium]
MNKRVMLTLLLIVTLVSHLWAQAQPQRLLFAIRGFGSSTSPQPTQALTLINLTTGVVRDSIAAIGPIANVIRVRNNRLYIVKLWRKLQRHSKLHSNHQHSRHHQQCYAAANHNGTNSRRSQPI